MWNPTKNKFLNMQITQPVKTLSKHFNSENSIFDQKCFGQTLNKNYRSYHIYRWAYTWNEDEIKGSHESRCDSQ